VPSRDSRTGGVTGQFRDVFEAWRGRTLPGSVDASTWSHLYRVGVNTRADMPAGGRVCLRGSLLMAGSDTRL
ncbi:MAG: hypothetical protein ACKOYJ_09830, partial [Planctomycetia bacterium]